MDKNGRYCRVLERSAGWELELTPLPARTSGVGLLCVKSSSASVYSWGRGEMVALWDGARRACEPNRGGGGWWRAFVSRKSMSVGTMVLHFLGFSVSPIRMEVAVDADAACLFLRPVTQWISMSVISKAAYRGRLKRYLPKAQIYTDSCFVIYTADMLQIKFLNLKNTESVFKKIKHLSGVKIHTDRSFFFK